MRIFWKQFMGIIGIVIVTFTLFGAILIYSTFQISIDKVKKQTVQNLGIYQYSIMTSIENLPDDYKMTASAAADIAETIFQSMGDTSNVMCLYDEKGTLLYQSGTLKITEEESPVGKDGRMEQNGQQRIIIASGEHYLENILWMDSAKGNFCLKLDQNIQYIYDSREQLYQNYKRILLVVVVIAMILAGIQAASFTKPIKQLSSAAEEFAHGAFSKRVNESGKDEITDLTKAFNAMAERLEANIGELEAAARKQEEFTAAFAHELKTPLTSIIGYSEMIRSMELSPEEQRSSVNYIYNQGKRLEALSYKMMELTGVRNQEWSFVKIPVRELLESVQQMTTGILEQKHIRLECTVEPGVIYGEKQLLESLLANLIDNARKASDENAVIQIKGSYQSSQYQLKICDQGCGIPEEEINKIHEAFYMVDKSRGRKEGGAGIGMALCEQILTLHHGKWQIESEVGVGTTIILEFPEEIDEEADKE